MRVLFIQKVLPQEMLGLAWLCTALGRAGHEPQVLLLPDPNWEERLRTFDPGLVAISTTTGDHVSYLRLIQRLKEVLDVPVVLGGPHPTFVPEVVGEPGVDWVCRGEGDAALVELCDRLAAGRSADDVQNFSAVRDGQRFDNPLRPLEADLDRLGVPDRAPLYEAAPIYRDCERKVFLTSRGCHYGCSFCFHTAWRDKLYKVDRKTYVRKRSVAHVLEELEEVRARWPLKFVHFVDDIFNVDDGWLEEFCRLYPKAVGLPFDVILRTNLTTADHMRQLRAAGCISARLAFEAASDRIRNDVYRKNTTLADLKSSARHVKEQGIRLTTLNLLGAPGATIEDELETLRLNVECRVDHPLCSLLQPYPETEIHEITRDMGLAVDDFDAFPEKFNRRTSIAYERGHEVENLHRLFPIVVRFPVLLPLVRRAIRSRSLGRVYLLLYLLWTEYLVCEQNRSWAVACGNAGLSSLPPIDLVRRVAAKTHIKLREKLFGRRFSWRALELEMETDTIAHAGG